MPKTAGMFYIQTETMDQSIGMTTDPYDSMHLRRGKTKVGIIVCTGKLVLLDSS